MPKVQRNTIPASSSIRFIAAGILLPNWLVLAMCGLLLAGPVQTVRAASEYELKAAFLLNFAQFVQWPADNAASTSGTVILGVLGKDPFGPAIARALGDRTINGRHVTMRHFSSLPEARNCHVLFISSSEEPQLDEILRSLANSSVLTVSDIARFTDSGGAIGLIQDGTRIHFEVNLEAANAAGLKINSDLLALAKAIKKAPKRN
jgi:hypothetical protein